jgi:phage tail sheath gpL-like
MSSTSITGLAANDPVPGSYLEVAFAQGVASLGTAVYAILLLGQKTTAGSATADTVIYGPNSQVPLSSEADAIALFGTGSPLHRMFRRAVKKNKGTPIHAVAVAESAGAAATGTITYTNNATGAGVTRVYVGEEYIEYSIASGNTPTNIADAVVLLVNAQTHWPATASNVAGVITLLWRTKGPQGNWGRYSATITGGIATTVSPTTVTFMSGGSTAPSFTNALAAILPYRYYYIVCEDHAASGSSAALTALISQVNTQAQPITGIRQRVFTSSVDTIANTTTLATGANATRGEVQWLQNSDRPPEELAADLAAIYALEEAPLSFRCNFAGYGSDAKTAANWDIKAPRSGTAPTRPNLVSALSNGISSIGVNANGSTYLVDRITMRSLNGAVSDYRIRDAHKVTIMDRLADDLNAKIQSQFQGKKIGSDPSPGARVPGDDVVTPRVFRAAVIKLLRDYEGDDKLENVDATIAGMIVQRESSPTTRLTARIPVDCIDVAKQFGVLLDQIG